MSSHMYFLWVKLIFLSLIHEGGRNGVHTKLFNGKRVHI